MSSMVALCTASLDVESSIVPSILPSLTCVNAVRGKKNNIQAKILNAVASKIRDFWILRSVDMTKCRTFAILFWTFYAGDFEHTITR